MVGSSPPMQAVYDRLARVAASDATVLVTGESGTGKELVARDRTPPEPARPPAVRGDQLRRDRSELIESELFGHERGSFTGADRQREGVFERAHQGTLFLDEISEMPLELQVKLLRVLESGTLTRVGGEKTVAVRRARRRGVEPRSRCVRCRGEVPDRPALPPRASCRSSCRRCASAAGDVRALARHFLAEMSPAGGASEADLGTSARGLEAYSFPGNVRELKNAVQQAFILAEKEIDAEHLPAGIRNGARTSASSNAGASPALSGGEVRLKVPCALADAERDVILATLDELDGDKARAAELLGISLKTLYSRLREYGARDRA